MHFLLHYFSTMILVLQFLLVLSALSFELSYLLFVLIRHSFGLCPEGGEGEL